MGRSGARWVNKDPYLEFGSAEAEIWSASTSPEQACHNAARVRTDGESDWGKFQDFLIGRFKTLPMAWDAMDTTGTGTLPLREFQAALCNTLQYCRAAEARRLFLSVCKS